MSNPDFERLVGPDRRQLPQLGGPSATVLVIALAVVVGLVALWPRGERLADLDPIGFADDTVTAEVAEARTGPCSYDAQLTCIVMIVVVLGGEHDGTVVTLDFPDEPGQPDASPGDRIHLSVADFGGTPSFQYADRDRGVLLVALAAGFAIAVVGLGRMRGLAALAGLAVSIGLLLLFILPAIVIGRDAVLVALVGGGAIMLVTLYLAHGYRPLTHAAALGAFGALILTVGLSYAAVALARFSGLVGDESFFLATLPDVDLRGLILAGITLGALGALDDVTVTQASAVWEVHGANPSLGADDLFRSGLRVGRDHIVSTVNTLLLAYAGAALPLLILFSLSGAPLGVVASSEVVAVEIVRTLVGSMGLISAVPLTTWLASRLAARAA